MARTGREQSTVCIDRRIPPTLTRFKEQSIGGIFHKLLGLTTVSHCSVNSYRQIFLRGGHSERLYFGHYVPEATVNIIVKPRNETSWVKLWTRKNKKIFQSYFRE